MKKDTHNIICIMAIIFLILITFSTITGVYVDTGVTFEIDSPLETYSVGVPMDFSRIIVAPTYIVFNTTGFNVTSTTAIDIQIDRIADSILYPATVDEELLSFTIVNTPGNTWFNISGFTPNLYYNVSKNAVFSNYYQANSTGNISIYDAIPGLLSQYIIAANGTTYNPIVTTTGVATDITNTGAVLYADLVYDGGESCDVWIEYGTTTAYGTDSTYNATKTSGGEFLYDFSWDLQNPSPLIDLNAVSHDDDEDFFQRFDCYGNIELSYVNYSLTKQYTGASYDIESFFTDYPLGSVSYSETTISTDDLASYPTTTWFNFKFNPPIQLVDIHEDSNIYGFGISVDRSPFNQLSIRASSNDNYEYGAYYYVDTDKWPYGDFDYDICFIINNGTSYSKNLSAGQLYRYRAVAKNTNTTSYGADAAFLTLPNETASGSAKGTSNFTTMNISFTPGDGANFTIIERNTTAGDWERGDATEIYNGTGTYFVDTNLTRDTTYYYRLWSVANWTYNPTVWQYSSGSGFYLFNSTSGLGPPYNGSSAYNTTSQVLNLTWSRGNFSDREIVVKNNNTWASNPGDGWVRQNSTNTWFNASENKSGYYTIWSYNATENIYSLTGLNIPWGAMSLSCFDEDHPQNGIVGWNIQISNSDFETTYEATNLTNWHYIDLYDIPFGDGTIFLVSNSSYESRTYIHDTAPNFIYNFTFYLPLALPPGGSGDDDYDENETYAEDYIIQVYGPLTEYGARPPIGGALVTISKYINVTEDYETIFSDTTAANGEVDVSLLPGTLYHIVVTHDDYYDADDHWTPTEIVFSDDRYFPIQMTPLDSGEDPPQDYDTFWDTITFTGVMTDIDGLNGTITITYSDGNLSTINTQIYIYEYYNDTSTLIYIITNTSENSFTYTTGVINTTRTYDVVMYFNNTANFDISSPVSLRISNINIWTLRTPFDIEERATNIFGPFSLGYANLIAAFLAIMALVMFGPHNTGIGIIASGFTLGITSLIFSEMFTGGFNPGLTLIIPLIVIVGGMYMLVKNPGGHL